MEFVTEQLEQRIELSVTLKTTVQLDLDIDTKQLVHDIQQATWSNLHKKKNIMVKLP